MAKNTRKSEHTMCDPLCIKEADLGRLDARIENNEKTGGEIKEALQRLVENHEKDKQESNNQFATVTAEITKISTTLQSSAELSKELLENQNKLLDQLNKLLLDKQDISNRQNSLSEALATQVTISERRHEKNKQAIETISVRLSKLEQHHNTIISIGALVVSLLTAAGLIAQIFQAFHE